MEPVEDEILPDEETAVEQMYAPHIIGVVAEDSDGSVSDNDELQERFFFTLQ